MQQNWKKHSVVFRPTGDQPWMLSHAQVPTPFWTREGLLRVYFGTRDATNRTSTTFLEVHPRSPSKIVRIHDRPVMSLGELGCFDDAGVMPGCLVANGNQIYFYYAGWNTSTTVSYRLAIGLAISNDGGETFERAFEGPILDRIAREPHLCGAPCVLNDRDCGVWRMWYPSGTSWSLVDGRAEPRYLIRYAESDDGIEWRRNGIIAIDYGHQEEALARPWVVKDGSLYRMWFSSRSIRDYRKNAQHSYRMGYAESSDGVRWERMDDRAGLYVGPTGWDSEMIAYPSIFDSDQNRYMLYNGNGFGTSGFGLAQLENAA
jgi:hypothetical protein